VMGVRLLLQQAITASLKLPPGPGSEEGELLLLDKATVVFVCFLKETKEEAVKKAARAVLSVKLTEEEEGAKRISVSSSQCQVLVVPQATLGGKLKHNSLQYHGNVSPGEGEHFYRMFCQELTCCLGEDRVRVGQYGARQVLSMETNGPFSHVLDIS